MVKRLSLLLLVLFALIGSSASVLGKDTYPAESHHAQAIGVISQSPTLEGCKPVTVKVPDLMYHMIEVPPSDVALPQLWVDPAEFRATLKLLKKNGWTTLTPRQVAKKIRTCQPIPPKTFTITFDDSARNGYTNAFPILQEFGFKAAFAVVVGRVDRAKSAMTWAMLTEMQAAGNEIANHTMDHDDVRAENADGLVYEIQQSNDLLATHLGIIPRTFVYPYGYWDSEAKEVVKAAGFWFAYTTVYGCTISATGRLTEERIRVNRSDSPMSVLRKLQACQ